MCHTDGEEGHEQRWDHGLSMSIISWWVSNELTVRCFFWITCEQKTSSRSKKAFLFTS